MSFSILVLASDGGAVPAPAGFTEAAAVSYTTTWGEAVAQIARDDVDLLALTPDASCVEGLVEWCDEHELERVLLVGREPEAVDHELAWKLGATGVIGPDGRALDATVARVRARREVRARRRNELEVWRVQSEELQRRCKQQAERFQQTQETFYLDLSRMMTIITNIMDGIVYVDGTGGVTMMNPVAEELLDVRSFMAIGKPVTELDGQDELVAALVADHARLSEAGSREVVQTVEVHDGEHDLRYIKCMTSAVLDYRGQPAGAMSVLRDVTAEHKTDQLKNQYLSIVAHELRTPLTGIKTFATMMAKGALGGLTEQQGRVCDTIKEQSIRLEHQIDKLVNLGNLESADYGQDREIFELEDFVAGMLLPFEQPARDRDIDLQLRCDVEGASLLGDRSDLRRACQALIENAVKFTRDGGRVTVSIEEGDDGPTFHVRDDGVGVDLRYQQRIFEKFFQVEDPLARHHGGAGLGLFVAQGIVEAHGSRIQVSSELGAGADFFFTLPLQRPEPCAVEASGGARASEDT